MHLDCGMLIYESKAQGTGAGGSGCGCSAVTLAGHFLKQVEQGKITAYPVCADRGTSFHGVF